MSNMPCCVRKQLGMYSTFCIGIVGPRDRPTSAKPDQEDAMIIGQRLREIREEKGLSQGDVERASGLLRCYISRVEHGHTVPSLETLERFAAALGVPLYRIFSSHDATTNLTARRSLEELAAETGPSGTEAR